MVGASAAWVGASLLHESEGGRDRSRLLAATEHHPHLGSGSSSRSARGRSTRIEAAELLGKSRAKGRTHEWWLDGKGRCGRSSGRHRPLRTGKGTAARASGTGVKTKLGGRTPPPPPPPSCGTLLAASKASIREVRCLIEVPEEAGLVRVVSSVPPPVGVPLIAPPPITGGVAAGMAEVFGVVVMVGRWMAYRSDGLRECREAYRSEDG